MKPSSSNNTYSLTLDTEVTVKNTIGNNKASPFCTSNNIVAIGALYDSGHGGPHDSVYFNRYFYSDGKFDMDRFAPYTIETVKDELPSIIIGQNLKFDIQWLYSRGVSFNNQYNGPINLYKVDWWDTMIAEYLLSAQHDKFPSLDYLADKYGMPLKDDEIKSHWATGGQTEDIEQGKLLDYLRGDVSSTHAVAMEQMKRAVDRDMHRFIMAQMDAAKAVSMMEYNGLHVDLSILSDIRIDLTKRLEELKAEANKLLKLKFGLPASVVDEHVNLNSNQHVSALLFGGDIKYKEKVSAGTYKNGKPKIRVVEQRVECQPQTTYRSAASIGGYYKVGVDDLKAVANHHSTMSPALKLVEILLETRIITKQLGTYIDSIAALVQEDGLVHHSIHETSTNTGRRSSS